MELKGSKKKHLNNEKREKNDLKEREFYILIMQFFPLCERERYLWSADREIIFADHPERGTRMVVTSFLSPYINKIKINYID